MNPWWYFTRSDVLWITIILTACYAITGPPTTLLGWILVAPSILLGKLLVALYRNLR
jgi:hypothetical protein